ncbi:spore germination protein [Cytobacillus sp. S13-E01]|uniref:spore germination protein n=1 Tax=Cytobacillus sp. S13-E01 TaxID=3031326 RepID=UPI0023D82C6E|nr:spore germination protein [Cytobacillus sp. S13-E01]MDF0728167.1 spore germination protein [Cytobacillus sp. S13-E01]
MVLQKKSDTQEWLKEQLGSSQDVVLQELKAEKNTAEIFYINSLCDEKKLQENVIKPFYECDEKEFEIYIRSLPNKKEHTTKEDTLTSVLVGSVVVFIGEIIYIVYLKKVVNNSVTEAMVETVIQGPQNALSESITTNINLIRNRYPQPSLRLEETKVGKLSQTKVIVMYDKKLTNKDVLKDLKDSLEQIEIDVLQAAGELHRKLTRKKRTLFPTLMITERPDRIVYNLAQGKVVLVIEGTPFSIIAPAVFYDFMSSMEDLYQPYWVSRFIVSLRYLGLFISVLMPALYVGVTAYSPELFRVQLALSIAGSRVGVPYPAYIEVFLMLLMMELLTEASVRLPKAIGSTATTVGGLILGQAAVEASLVSNVMIIIVAAVAISNFVIPINTMSFAMRVVKYLLLASSTLFGLVGLVIGLIGLIAYLANLESFGQPYLKLFFEPSSKDSKKGVRPS